MKRLFFVIIITLFGLLTQAQTKVELSFTASPSINWMHSDMKQIQKGNAILGYDFGVNADFPFGDNGQYAFGSGLLITSTGGNLKFLNDQKFNFSEKQLAPMTDVKYMLRYLEVPAVLKMKTSQFHRSRFWGEFGLSAMINIQAKGTSSDGVFDRNTINDEVDMFNIALNVGLGMDYDLGGNNAFRIGLVFKNGLSDITTNSDIEDKCIMNSLKLKLAVVF